MHERSLVRSLLRQVFALQPSDGGGRVVEIRVTMGEFSGVDAELFALAYEELVDETALAGAVLRLRSVPLTARCGECGREFEVVRFQFACPGCDDRRVEVIRGEGIQLESLIVETET